MYRDYYSEVLEDCPSTARSNERTVILHSIQLLARAEENGARSRETVEALYFLRRLWEHLIVDLGGPENQLPTQLRANLISVGIGLLREADAIRRGESDDLASLIEISQAVADGLV